MNIKSMPARARGFTLVELLVVIAVLGVMTALVIPVMSSIFGTADDTVVRRNAQNIVCHFNSARGAGNRAVFGDVNDAIAAVTTSSGITGGGAYSTTVFLCPLSTVETINAASYITTIGTGADLQLAVRQ